MITARPAAAALRCRSCHNTVLRAVSTSQPTTITRSLTPKSSFSRYPTTTFRNRFFATEQASNSNQIAETVSTAKEAADGAELEAAVKDEDDDLWFLEEDDIPRHPTNQHAVDLPKAPEGAPAVLEPMIKYVYEDMGLDELSLLDLRELDPPAAIGPNLIMLFATARSERHLHVSAGRFQKWLKRQHKISARAGGLIGPGELKTKLRRLRKKAKLMGTNTAVIPGGDNGISTGWVCVNFNTTGTEAEDDSANFDVEGKFSGFGAVQDGVTVVVQCMTEARRNEMDLETLWQQQLKRSLRDAEAVKGNSRPDPAMIDAKVASRLQLSGSESALNWQALKQASSNQSQRRHYSTSARRLVQFGSPTTKDSSTPTMADQDIANPNFAISIDDLRSSLNDLQILGHPIANEEALGKMIGNILLRPLSDDNTAAERLVLLDRLLLTAHERGFDVMSRPTLVNLIEGLVRSPDNGPDYKRALGNIEQILASIRVPLETSEVERLLHAHASTSDWDRFWDVFQWNVRFQLPRGSGVYATTLSIMAQTGSPRLCQTALRRVFPEMKAEKPAVESVGEVYNAFRACLRIAEPIAEEWVARPPELGTLPVLTARSIKQNEFRWMLERMEHEREAWMAERAHSMIHNNHDG